VSDEIKAKAELLETAEHLIRVALAELQVGFDCSPAEARAVLRVALRAGTTMERPCLTCRAVTGHRRESGGWECLGCLTWTAA
jgi:hypothetical protein